MDYEEFACRPFEVFKKQWALVTAGNMERFNSCTVSWGGMGTLWTRPGSSGSVITVYIHPARYTRELLMENETFTVSFFSEEFKKALSYMGACSGRDTDKAAGAGLTPVSMGGSVAYAEAERTFLCRKVYQHRLAREDIAPDVQEYYRANPKVYPVDENGEWQPHYIFIGEIIEVDEKRKYDHLSGAL